MRKTIIFFLWTANLALGGSYFGSSGNTLGAGKIVVGNSAGVASDVSMSGDTSIDNTGQVSIGNGKVSNAMLAGSVALSKLASQADQTILGNNAGSSASPTALSTSTVASMLNGFLGFGIGSPVTGGAANRVIFEDGSQNTATSSNLTYSSNRLTTQAATMTGGNITDVNQEVNRIVSTTINAKSGDFTGNVCGSGHYFTAAGSSPTWITGEQTWLLAGYTGTGTTNAFLAYNENASDDSSGFSYSVATGCAMGAILDSEGTGTNSNNIGAQIIAGTAKSNYALVARVPHTGVADTGNRVGIMSYVSHAGSPSQVNGLHVALADTGALRPDVSAAVLIDGKSAGVDLLNIRSDGSGSEVFKINSSGVITTPINGTYFNATKDTNGDYWVGPSTGGGTNKRFAITNNTADGSDNLGLQLCGGGYAGASDPATRGAFIDIFGNEFSASASRGGAINYHVGSVTGSAHYFYDKNNAVILSADENGAVVTKVKSPGFYSKEAAGGADCSGGATLSGGTVTVTTSCAKTSSRIFIQDTTTGILTNVGVLVVSAKNNGSFVITSTVAIDTSTADWFIVNSY